MYSLCLEHCIGARPIAFHRSSAHFIPKLSRTNYYRNSLSSGEISSSRSTKMFTRRTECTVDKFIQILDGYSICAYECVCVCVCTCVCVCVCVCAQVCKGTNDSCCKHMKQSSILQTLVSVYSQVNTSKLLGAIRWQPRHRSPTHSSDTHQNVFPVIASSVSRHSKSLSCYALHTTLGTCKCYL